jgi:predicted nuclease of predicted toxin-antitoxin system
MRVLLDQGLPRSAAKLLRDAGIDAIHTAECDLATATDSDILEYARRQDQFVVTLEADFHAILVLRHAVAPSVIRIRIEGLRAEAIVDLLQAVLRYCDAELTKGAMVSVTSNRIRIRCLPV